MLITIVAKTIAALAEMGSSYPSNVHNTISVHSFSRTRSNAQKKAHTQTRSLSLSPSLSFSCCCLVAYYRSSMASAARLSVASAAVLDVVSAVVSDVASAVSAATVGIAIVAPLFEATATATAGSVVSGNVSV